MNLTDWFAERDRDRAARTRLERHGAGEITFFDERQGLARGDVHPKRRSMMDPVSVMSRNTTAPG